MGDLEKSRPAGGENPSARPSAAPGPSGRPSNASRLRSSARPGRPSGYLARASAQPSGRPSRVPCHDLVEIASLDHYVLRIDRKCRLVVAIRTETPFEAPASIRACFRRIEFSLADIPRSSYRLLVDARQGPRRNDKGFELILEEERGRLLFGFSRNAALAATAAGRLQIQRYAKRDQREVFATDVPAEAFEYLGVRPHVV